MPPRVFARGADGGSGMTQLAFTAVGGAAAHALIRTAEGADLLVVGRRGRGGFASTVLGSVSMQCVLHAPCAVTVVHPVGDHAAVDDVLTATAHRRQDVGSAQR